LEEEEEAELTGEWSGLGNLAGLALGRSCCCLPPRAVDREKMGNLGVFIARAWRVRTRKLLGIRTLGF
jgi:hypothetical protein